MSSNQHFVTCNNIRMLSNHHLTNLLNAGSITFDDIFMTFDHIFDRNVSKRLPDKESWRTRGKQFHSKVVLCLPHLFLAQIPRYAGTFFPLLFLHLHTVALTAYLRLRVNLVPGKRQLTFFFECSNVHTHRFSASMQA